VRGEQSPRKRRSFAVLWTLRGRLSNFRDAFISNRASIQMDRRSPTHKTFTTHGTYRRGDIRTRGRVLLLHIGQHRREHLSKVKCRNGRGLTVSVEDDLVADDCGSKRLNWVGRRRRSWCQEVRSSPVASFWTDTPRTGLGCFL
jgi:hypothetical protein